MVRSQLVAQLHSEHPHLSRAQIEAVVACFFDSVADTLERGGRVELRGFGAFSVRERPARTGRNPRTGAAVHVPAKSTPFFKSGKDLRATLNLAGDDESEG